MKITGADHANWRIKDVERSLGFYRDILGLETFGLREFREGERSFVSVRVSPTFTLHLRPDPKSSFGYVGDQDHLALVVEEVDPDTLENHLEDAGLEIERRFGSALGARGDGPALYVRDPDGYLIELKFYGV
jgi:catechol 2,3-dioxygenase-like lactoylglutathione lyase family enzyme